MMILSNKYIAPTILITTCAVGLYFFSSNSSSKSNSKNKTDIGVVSKQDLIQRVTIAGGVTPNKKAIITAPYNGYVKKLFVKIGDSVKQGDPLVSVTPSLQSNDNPFPLRAPFSGTVVQIEKSEGEFIKEGDIKDFILRIDDTSKMFILANSPEIDRVKVKLNQEAVIKASAIINKQYKGVIRELSLASRNKDEWSRSQIVEFPIKIEITDPDELIKSGMSAVIDIITAKKENVLMLRHEFIRRDNQNYYVVLETGKRKDIQVGLQNEEGFEVVSGLAEGEKIKQVDFSDLNVAE